MVILYGREITVRIIPPRAPLAFTWPMSPEPGHLSIVPPAFALLHLLAIDRNCWNHQAHQYHLAIEYRFRADPIPRQGCVRSRRTRSTVWYRIAGQGANVTYANPVVNFLSRNAHLTVPVEFDKSVELTVPSQLWIDGWGITTEIITRWFLHARLDPVKAKVMRHKSISMDAAAPIPFARPPAFRRGTPPQLNGDS